MTTAIRGQSDAVLSRRPDARNWAAKEVVCHLRDIEELFMLRFETIMAADEPAVTVIDPDRWAQERQYARNAVLGALAAFTERRRDTLAFVDGLRPAQWDRAAVHPSRGPLSIRKIVHSLANHDGEHFDQISRALAGRA